VHSIDQISACWNSGEVLFENGQSRPTFSPGQASHYTMNASPDEQRGPQRPPSIPALVLPDAGRLHSLPFPGILASLDVSDVFSQVLCIFQRQIQPWSRCWTKHGLQLLIFSRAMPRSHSFKLTHSLSRNASLIGLALKLWLSAHPTFPAMVLHFQPWLWQLEVTHYLLHQRLQRGPLDHTFAILLTLRRQCYPPQHQAMTSKQAKHTYHRCRSSQVCRAVNFAYTSKSSC